MGRYFSMYVGPYLKSGKTRAKVTKKVTSCTNESCHKHGDYLSCNFCPTCGSKVANISVESEQDCFMHYQDVFEESKDVRAMGYTSEELASYEIYDNIYWICNRDNDSATSYQDEDEYAIEMPTDMSDILCDFEIEYQPLIAYMKDKYNLDVTAHYGTVITWR